MHYLFYVTKYIHVIHTLASHLWDQQGNWGQSGVDISKQAGYSVCDGNMSKGTSIIGLSIINCYIGSKTGKVNEIIQKQSL